MKSYLGELEMMRRFALMLPCLALAASLGACNQNDLSALQAAGVTPTVQEGALSPAAIAASGLPQATQDKLTKGLAKIEQVRAAAAKLCGFVPIASSVANVFIAASATTQTVQGIAKLTCAAIGSAPAYASLEPGERYVSHRAVIQGQEVVVAGYLRPLGKGAAR